MSNRATRAVLAQETVSILDRGWYVAPSGRRVDVGETLRASLAGTRLYTPQELRDLIATRSMEMRDPCGEPEVTNETTLAAGRRWVSKNVGRVAALNFASAKNPGGGFLGGSMAQEESLAIASGLYSTLLECPEYYTRNRVQRSLLYTDHAIYSPAVPVFRDDNGELLEYPYCLDFITMPAPNVGAMREGDSDLALVQDTFERRVRAVAAVALAHQAEVLVLGAWGCGVFRNNPTTVASIFGKIMHGEGASALAFAGVTYAVLDRLPGQPTFRAFQQMLVK